MNALKEILEIQNKPGHKTTEFWLAVIVMLAGMLMIWQGDSAQGTELLKWGGGAYAGARGLAKLKLHGGS